MDGLITQVSHSLQQNYILAVRAFMAAEDLNRTKRILDVALVCVPTKDPKFQVRSKDSIIMHHHHHYHCSSSHYLEIRTAQD